MNRKKANKNKHIAHDPLVLSLLWGQMNRGNMGLRPQNPSPEEKSKDFLKNKDLNKKNLL